MSRYLFVVPPLVGHVNPAVGVAQALGDRGHEVAWVAHELVVGSVLGAGPDGEVTVYPAGDRFLADVVEHLPERGRLKGPAALRFLWERILGPLARDMVGPVEAAVDDFGPDVIVTDQQTFAGGIVAHDRGLPWAVSACSTAELVDPLAQLPKVAAWRRRLLAELYADLGRSHLAEQDFDPRFTPHVQLQFSTPELVGDLSGPATTCDLSTVAFVGPVLPGWADPVPFPWDWLEHHRRHVFVSLGTLSQDEGVRFLTTVVQAVTGKPYGVVMVGQPEALDVEVPDNVLIRPFVPQQNLLPRVDAVVCHAGHNTTVGALSFGVPLVCAPMREDQPIIAEQVVRAGAGRRVSFWRARTDAVAEALDAVLEDPSYREAAAAIARSFRAAGGAPAAAARLEALATATRELRFVGEASANAPAVSRR